MNMRRKQPSARPGVSPQEKRNVPNLISDSQPPELGDVRVCGLRHQATGTSLQQPKQSLHPFPAEHYGRFLRCVARICSTEVWARIPRTY